MNRHHHYSLDLQWTGNNGEGTSGYRTYERLFTISIENKPQLHGSSDPAFRGDKTKHNPEEMFLASLSSCHMLWYLHLCADQGIVVEEYTDHATAIMEEDENGGGRFTVVTLHPIVTIKEMNMREKAIELHAKANSLCFIAASVNFEVKHEAEVISGKR